MVNTVKFEVDLKVERLLNKAYDLWNIILFIILYLSDTAASQYDDQSETKFYYFNLNISSN